jgi:hypothetical protein
MLVFQQKAIEQQRQYLFISIGFITIILILAFELYRSNRKIKSINKALDERVADRTKELLEQRDELVHNREEQKLSKQKIYRELRSQINSLGGIINLARIDRVNSAEQYLDQASSTLWKLDLAAKKLNGEAKID